MYEHYTKNMVGLEVVEVCEPSEGGVAILFQDGIILYVGGENGVVFAQGTGWEEMWESLKTLRGGVGVWRVS